MKRFSFLVNNLSSPLQKINKYQDGSAINKNKTPSIQPSLRIEWLCAKTDLRSDFFG